MRRIPRSNCYEFWNEGPILGQQSIVPSLVLIDSRVFNRLTPEDQSITPTESFRRLYTVRCANALQRDIGANVGFIVDLTTFLLFILFQTHAVNAVEKNLNPKL